LSFLFFFSSRRRHTRSKRDWSSDVCSSDLLKANPNAPFTPKTYIFGAKAAPGYYMAKQMIRMICKLGNLIDSDPAVKGKLSVVYLEDYCVTLSEQLMPASEVSEQISLAGTEASGTDRKSV